MMPLSRLYLYVYSDIYEAGQRNSGRARSPRTKFIYFFFLKEVVIIIEFLIFL